MLLSRIITITISYDGKPCQKMYLEFKIKKKQRKKTGNTEKKKENDKDNNFDQTEIIPIDIPSPPHPFEKNPYFQFLLFNLIYYTHTYLL